MITAAEGMPVTWCLADAKLGEREGAGELFGHALDTGALREGMVVLADKGLSAKPLERYCADQLGVLFVRPDRNDVGKIPPGYPTLARMGSCSHTAPSRVCTIFPGHTPNSRTRVLMVSGSPLSGPK
ncbi:hypothetical protein SAMN06265360_12157 [Haloechinothrix alba]|uniref:Transposase DDE domain-containing protein n=1 Tax=Haloechinothrix alba TaxID=664784 RepID=A0A238ZGN9_9PSEU|nr:hypothetical protein [Haloechinothrix alba]SNR82497.1 hypothetical protein SAMN06265360_12157 [Haloechinothrix alba]